MKFIVNDLFSSSTISQLKESIKDVNILYIDTETTGLDPYLNIILCYQIGFYLDGIFEIYVVDNRHYSISLLKEELESKILVGQNLKFDLKFLNLNGVFPTKCKDAMLNEINLTNGLYKDIKGKYNLQFLVKKYCNEHLDKSVRANFSIKKWDAPLTYSELFYAGNDVKYLPEILEKQEELSIKQQLVNCCSLENNFVIELAKLELAGVLIDIPKWKELSKKVDLRYKEILDKLNSYIKKQTFTSNILDIYTKRKDKKSGEEIIKKSKHQFIIPHGDLFTTEPIYNISWTSPQQVVALLNALGYNINSVSKQILLDYRGDELIDLLLEFSEFDALKTKFTDPMLGFINPKTGRIHTEYWQLLVTGRLSSSKPNCQNIPSQGSLAEEIRSCFVSKPGYDLITIDVSGFELRILAEMSGEDSWIEEYQKEDADLHSVNAALIFDIPIEDVKKPFYLNPHTTYRYVSKTNSFMLVYGGGASKLANVIKIELPKAKEIVNKFFFKAPKVKKCLDDLAYIARTYFVSRTLPPIFRARYYPFSIVEEELSGYERQGKNAPMQGVNSDCVKLAIILINKYFKDNNIDAQIVLQVHDEIVIECREDLSIEVKDKAIELMKKAASYQLKKVPIECSFNIGKYWKK